MSYRNSPTFNTAKFARRVLLYFAILMPLIGAMAGIQYLHLNSMPGWPKLESLPPGLITLDVLPRNSMVVASRNYLQEGLPSNVEKELLFFRDDNLKLIGHLRPDDSRVTKLSTCGTYLAYFCYDGTLRVSEIALPNRLHRPTVIPLDEHDVRDLGWSPDSTVVLISTERKIRLWNRLGCLFVCEHDFDKRTKLIVPTSGACFGFSQNGQYRLALWQTGEIVGNLPIGFEANFIQMSNDNKRVAYTLGRDLRVIDLNTHRSLLTQSYTVAGFAPNGFALSEGGERLAIIENEIASNKNCIRVLDVSTEKVLIAIPVEYEYCGVQIVDNILWAWTFDGVICKWDLDAPSECVMHFLVRDPI